MMLCAILFAPFALPRETISGLLGRWEVTKHGAKHWVGRIGSAIVDRIYFWEPDHCVEVYLCEVEARAVLYPEKPGAKP